MHIAHAVLPSVGCSLRFGRDRQARRAGHAANVLRRVALPGRATGDAVVLGVIPVDETNLGFHEDLRGAAHGAQRRCAIARLRNLLISPADSQ